MPTIDQLAPATAASDTDELISSQNGIARKVTRAQLVAGLQPQIALSNGSLLGRSSLGIGEPEQLGVGANLVLLNGTLSAAAAPFQIAGLPAGVTPASADLIPLGQGGANVAVSYAQLANGLSRVGGVDISAMSMTPSGGTTQKVSDFAAGTLAKAGGTMTGALTLAGDPGAPLQAATKQYVDGQMATSLSKGGGTLTGPLTLPTNPQTSMQAATKQYVDAQVGTALALAGGSLTGPLAAPSLSVSGAASLKGSVTAGSLSASQTGTAAGTLSSEVMLLRSGSGPSDAPILSSSLSVNHAGGGQAAYFNAAFPTVVNDAVDGNGNIVDGPANSVSGIRLDDGS